MNRLSCFYKSVFCCFNDVFVSDLETFKENIVNECIWGNKFITFRQGVKKCVLFLRNWIRSGVNRISDLKFVDGKLDEKYIYQKIGFSGNILREVFLVKNALLPYQNELRNISSDTITEAQNVYGFCKSKVLYSLLLNNLTANIPSTTKFLRQYCATDDVNHIFTKKVSLEREIKLREFNFKVLHGILPCNKNLKQWKVKISDHCDVCFQIQTIEHLLWSCRYVQSLWKIVENVLEVNLDFNMILGIRDNCEHPYVLTLVSFLPPAHFCKTAGGIVLGSVAVSAVSVDVLLYISVAIKASFLKLGMCNICKHNIAKMFLDFFFKFKIVHLIEVFKIFGEKSSECRISKTAGWIFTKFALQVHLSL